MPISISPEDREKALSLSLTPPGTYTDTQKEREKAHGKAYTTA